MKYLIALLTAAAIAIAAEVQADTYVYDMRGNLICIERGYIQSPGMRPAKRLRYVQSCPDGQCGRGFSGGSPMGDPSSQDYGTPDNQDITSYRPRQQSRRPSSRVYR